MDQPALFCRNETLRSILSRKSVRGFLSRKVSATAVHTILQAASRAPSGSNIQPWKVHVVSGQARDKLASALSRAYELGIIEEREYTYYPVNWREPYLTRRRATGWGLYNALGIKKGDRKETKHQLGRNFVFFGAPVVFFITIDKDMELGSWLDTGMFIQNILISARALGLHTCPQAAVVNYPTIVREHLSIPQDQTLVCGISLGYEDTGHPANQFSTTRVDINEFTVFHAK